MTEQDMLNLFLVFTAGAFWGEKAFKGALVVHDKIKKKMDQRRTEKKMKSMIDGLREAAQKAMADHVPDTSKAERTVEKKADPVFKSNRKPTVQEFMWRHGGKINTVNIVIDPNLDECFQKSPEEFSEAVKSGELGKLEALMGDLANGKNDLKETTDFVFSAKAVVQMKAMGVEPEDLVSKMLKAAGRMD